MRSPQAAVTAVTAVRGSHFEILYMHMCVCRAGTYRAVYCGSDSCCDSLAYSLPCEKTYCDCLAAAIRTPPKSHPDEERKFDIY